MTENINLPMIKPTSPLAEGATVNIRGVGKQGEHQLRIWIAGAPVEDSVHPTASAAVKRLVAIILDRFGGQTGVVGLLLGALANAEREEIDRR